MNMPELSGGTTTSPITNPGKYVLANLYQLYFVHVSE